MLNAMEQSLRHGDQPVRDHLRNATSRAQLVLAFEMCQEIADELGVRHIDTIGKNFYEMLEVDPTDFSASKLKTNYYALAKKYHPDKYRKFGNDALNDTLERILNMLNNAYETLKDPLRRSTRSGAYVHAPGDLAAEPVLGLVGDAHALPAGLLAEPGRPSGGPRLALGVGGIG